MHAGEVRVILRHAQWAYPAHGRGEGGAEQVLHLPPTTLLHLSQRGSGRSEDAGAEQVPHLPQSLQGMR